MTTTAYSVFVLSVLLFVCQLDSPPPEWEQAEAKAMRALAPGPGNWCTPEDLHNLTAMGFTKGFPRLHMLATAIKFRVASNEAAARGGLFIADKAAELLWYRTNGNFMLRAGTWGRWYGRFPV